MRPFEGDFWPEGKNRRELRLFASHSGGRKGGDLSFSHHHPKLAHCPPIRRLCFAPLALSLFAARNSVAGNERGEGALCDVSFPNGLLLGECPFEVTTFGAGSAVGKRSVPGGGLMLRAVGLLRGVFVSLKGIPGHLLGERTGKRSSNLCVYYGGLRE